MANHLLEESLMKRFQCWTAHQKLDIIKYGIMQIMAVVPIVEIVKMVLELNGTLEEGT